MRDKLIKMADEMELEEQLSMTRLRILLRSLKDKSGMRKLVDGLEYLLKNSSILDSCLTANITDKASIMI
jgi:hypothetical protein